MALHQIARMIDEAHAEIGRERDRRALEFLDDACIGRPVIVDNGPVIVAWLIPMTIGILLGAIGHMAWLAVRG